MTKAAPSLSSLLTGRQASAYATLVSVADTEDDNEGSWNPIERVGRSERTAGLVSGIENAISTFRRERKIGKGTMRATYVEAYRGYIAEGRASIRLRVMEEPVVPPPAEALTDPEILRSNVRRFVALPFPGVNVRAQHGDAFDEVVTDRHGYAVAHIPLSDTQPGWYDITVTTQPVDESEPVAVGKTRALLPDPTAQVWVVSDIDDTILQTGLAEGMAALKTTLLGQARTRNAVPGMSMLYRALEAGVERKQRAAFFYLSTGPWNLYSMLTEFMRVRGFPTGPLFLTDWGPQERYVRRSGVQHKLGTLRRLLTVYPDVPVILIGDSGQRDIDTYTIIAREFGDRVRTVIILDVGIEDRRQIVSQKAQDAREEGIDLLFVTDAREAAVELAERGFITEDAIAAVSLAYERS